MNRFGLFLGFLGAFFVAVASMSSASLAANSSSITGTVVSASDLQPISAAKIDLIGGVGTLHTTSSKSGYFEFLSLAPGTYTLRTSATQYQATESNPLSLAAGQQISLTVSLQPVTTTNISTLGRISVTGHAPLNTSSTASVSVSNTQFINQGATQVQNYLEQLNGITIDRPNGVTSAPGAVTTFTIRGAGAFGGGTDGTANTGYEILVLQDGEPIRNGEFGDFDASALTPAIYSRVEVIKGVGGTSLFGANTVGGTINLVTRDPTRTEGGEFIQSFGGYGTTDTNISESNTFGRFGYLFNLHRFGTDGYVAANFLADFFGTIAHPTQTMNLKSGLAKLRYDFSNSTYLVVGASLESDYRDQLGLISNPFLNPDGSEQFDSQGFPLFFGFPENFVYNTQPKYTADLHTSLGGGDLILRTYSQTLQRIVDGTSPAVCCFLSRSLDRLTGDLISWSKDFGNNALTLAVGANGDNFLFGESFAGPVPLTSIKPSAQGIQIERTYLVRDDWTASPKLDVTLAGYYSDYDTLQVKRFDPRLGLVFKPDADSVIHASVGTGFAPPRLSDLFSSLDLFARDASFGPGCSSPCVAFEGNPSLKAETATGYDLGYRRVFTNNGQVDVDLYRTDLKNHIFDGIFAAPAGLTFDDGTPVTWIQQALNIAGTVYQGIEFNGTAPFSPNFNVNATYNVQIAYPTGVDMLTEQQLGNVINNQQYLGLPLQKWGWTLNYRNANRSSLFFGGNYFGKNNSYNRPPFWIYNAGAEVAANDNDRFHVAWTNIFNKNAGIWEDFGLGIPYPSIPGCVPCFSLGGQLYPTDGYNSPPHTLTVSYDHRWGALRQQ